MDMESCIAVVSGGASGLGEATVRYLVEKGARASIFDLAEENGEKIASELGDSVIFCRTDVTDENSVHAAVDTTVGSFGGITAAVNCAGVATPGKVIGKEGPMETGSFNQVIQINLVGTMNVIKLVAEKMLKNEPNEDGERGVVINTASIAAFEGQYGQAAYASSKAAVAGMALPVAREFAGYGIRIMTIAPGLFETPMMAGMSEKIKESLIEMTLFPKRLGRPLEYARLVGHIIENPILNAEVIRLDGGMRMAGK